MPRVSMLLTDKDCENTAYIQGMTKAVSKAHAVAIALSLTAYICGNKANGRELLFGNPDGSFDRIVIEELESNP